MATQLSMCGHNYLDTVQLGTSDGSKSTRTGSSHLLPSAVHSKPCPRRPVPCDRDGLCTTGCVHNAVTLPWCETTSGSNDLLIFDDDDIACDDEEDDAAAADEEVAAALASVTENLVVPADDCTSIQRYNVAACRLSPLWSSGCSEPAGAGGLRRERRLERLACSRSSVSAEAAAGDSRLLAASGVSDRSPQSRGIGSGRSRSLYYFGGSSASEGSDEGCRTNTGAVFDSYEPASARHRLIVWGSIPSRSAFTLADGSSAMKVTNV